MTLNGACRTRTAITCLTATINRAKYLSRSMSEGCLLEGTSRSSKQYEQLAKRNPGLGTAIRVADGACTGGNDGLWTT